MVFGRLLLVGYFLYEIPLKGGVWYLISYIVSGKLLLVKWFQVGCLFHAISGRLSLLFLLVSSMTQAWSHAPPEARLL